MNDLLMLAVALFLGFVAYLCGRYHVKESWLGLLKGIVAGAAVLLFVLILWLLKRMYL